MQNLNQGTCGFNFSTHRTSSLILPIKYNLCSVFDLEIIFFKLDISVTLIFLFESRCPFPHRPRWAGGSKSLHEDKAEEAHEAIREPRQLYNRSWIFFAKINPGEQKGVGSWWFFNSWIMFIVMMFLVMNLTSDLFGTSKSGSGCRQTVGVGEPMKNLFDLIWRKWLRKNAGFWKRKMLWIDSSGPRRSTPQALQSALAAENFQVHDSGHMADDWNHPLISW